MVTDGQLTNRQIELENIHNVYLYSTKSTKYKTSILGL